MGLNKSTSAAGSTNEAKGSDSSKGTPAASPGGASAADEDVPQRPSRAANDAKTLKNRRQPGAYRYVERCRDGRQMVRWRTHMGQLCKEGTTPDQAVEMWAQRQRRIRMTSVIGRRDPRRLGAMLTPEHRAQYEGLLAGSGYTNQMLADWLGERGYIVSTKFVQEHRQDFLLSLMDVRQAATMAGAFTAAAREQAPGAIAEAAAGRTEQLFMEMLFEMKPQQRAALTVKDWLELQKASGGLVAGRRMMEQMRAEFDDRARRAAAAVDAAAVAGAGKRGKPGVAVANRVREILGIPLTDEHGNEVGEEP